MSALGRKRTFMVQTGCFFLPVRLFAFGGVRPLIVQVRNPRRVRLLALRVTQQRRLVFLPSRAICFA